MHAGGGGGVGGGSGSGSRDDDPHTHTPTLSVFSPTLPPRRTPPLHGGRAIGPRNALYGQHTSYGADESAMVTHLLAAPRPGMDTHTYTHATPSSGYTTPPGISATSAPFTPSWGGGRGRSSFTPPLLARGAGGVPRGASRSHHIMPHSFDSSDALNNMSDGSAWGDGCSGPLGPSFSSPSRDLSSPSRDASSSSASLAAVAAAAAARGHAISFGAPPVPHLVPTASHAHHSLSSSVHQGTHHPLSSATSSGYPESVTSRRTLSGGAGHASGMGAHGHWATPSNHLGDEPHRWDDASLSTRTLSVAASVTATDPPTPALKPMESAPAVGSCVGGGWSYEQQSRAAQPLLGGLALPEAAMDVDQGMEMDAACNAEAEAAAWRSRPRDTLLRSPFVLSSPNRPHARASLERQLFPGGDYGDFTSPTEQTGLVSPTEGGRGSTLAPTPDLLEAMVANVLDIFET